MQILPLRLGSLEHSSMQQIDLLEHTCRTLSQPFPQCPVLLMFGEGLAVMQDGEGQVLSLSLMQEWNH